MAKDYSNKKLHSASFKNEDLDGANFSNSDLRGADLSGASLRGADFSNSRTGITPGNTALIFVAAFIISLVSGYIAMVAGRAIQFMLASKDSNVRNSGIATIVVIILFLAYSYWKGVGTGIKNLLIPAGIVALILGLIGYITGAGSGLGGIYIVLAFILVIVMVIVGTIARAAAGSLSNILFIVVALAGGLFGKSIGGGIGSVIMAIACALISKRALSGASGFRGLQELTTFITSRFGTNFRNSKLANANFSKSRIRNTDFREADLSSANWGDTKKVNCLAS